MNAAAQGGRRWHAGRGCRKMGFDAAFRSPSRRAPMPPDPSLSFSLSFGYWDRVRATLTLIAERPLTLALTSLWPLGAIVLAGYGAARGVALGELPWLALAFLFFFVPLMVLIGAAATHFFHRQSREPFTYVFDEVGIHVSATTYEYTHKWPAIFKVKRKAGFLLFFFSPGYAHCIPYRAVPDRAMQAALIAMAGSHGADTRGAQQGG